MSICLSVRLSITSRYCIKTSGIELVFGMEAYSIYPILCYKEICVSPRIRVLPSGNLSRTPDFENFAAASKSRCQQNLLSPSSVVELVDDTYMTVDESWLFTTSRLTVTLLLHYFDLLWICCTVCFFDEILTEIACRAVCLQ